MLWTSFSFYIMRLLNNMSIWIRCVYTRPRQVYAIYFFFLFKLCHTRRGFINVHYKFSSHHSMMMGRDRTRHGQRASRNVRFHGRHSIFCPVQGYKAALWMTSFHWKGPLENSGPLMLMVMDKRGKRPAGINGCRSLSANQNRKWKKDFLNERAKGKDIWK